MTPDWIAVDWGTSHLRLWLMAADGSVLDKLSSADGMGQLDRDGYERCLLDLIGDRLKGSTRVLVCGMAGSRQGWAESPYAQVPCAPPSLDQATRVNTADARLHVRILPGLRQMSPPDVMRGEETQIAGFLAAEPGFDGILCLPGTHCKWAHISAGEVVSFRTFMTGELFALLSGQSVLRHSVDTESWDAEAFRAALDDTLSKPSGLAAQLFGIRAGQLLNGTAPQTGRARLSGLLIGAELSAARPYWLGQQVVILGADALATAYLTALQAQGVMARTLPADDITLAGLRAAFATWKD